jgi:hypothetical protein
MALFVTRVVELDCGFTENPKIAYLLADSSTTSFFRALNYLELDPKHIRCEDTYKEHYVISPEVREKALSYGAQPISRRELGLLLRDKKNQVAFFYDHYDIMDAKPTEYLFGIKHICIRWEAWKRRQGGVWPAMNRGTAGYERAKRLWMYLQRRNRGIL